MPPVDRSAWEHLGKLLAERRAELSPRYRNRRLFADETGLNWRTIHDVELAKRDNFKSGTMRAFESAYGLVAGSLDRTLKTGELEPLPPAPEPRPPQPPPGTYTQDSDSDAAAILFPHDVAKRWIWRTPDATEEEKARMIRTLDELRRGTGREQREQAG